MFYVKISGQNDIPCLTHEEAYHTACNFIVDNQDWLNQCAKMTQQLTKGFHKNSNCYCADTVLDNGTMFFITIYTLPKGENT